MACETILVVKVGHVGTSKKDQNPDLQRRELEAAGCEKTFKERIRPDKRWRSMERCGITCV